MQQRAGFGAAVEGEGGFWLVSQTARLLNDVRRTNPPDAEVVPLWDDHARKCRAFYRRSENAIEIVWGKAHGVKAAS